MKEEEEEPPAPKVPDADQGVRGLPPGAGAKRSPDSWLMQVTDKGRGELVGDQRHYDDLYGAASEE